MATYYKKIKGKHYDSRLLSKADRSVRGRGDGRISLSDAKALLKTVKDSAHYSDIEKATMRHIRDNYDFTPEADRWFRSQIRSWAATKGPGNAPAKKKGARKPASRTKAAAKKKPSPRRQQLEQEYIAPPSELIEREPISGGKTRSKAPAVILLLLVAAVLGLFLYPKSREWLTDRFKPSAPATESIAEKPSAPETPPVATEPAQPEKKPEPVTVEKPAPPPVDEGNYYIVQVHEGLVTIAEKELKDYRRWVEIYRLNKATIPYTLMLYPGQKLKMPEGWSGNR